MVNAREDNALDVWLRFADTGYAVDESDDPDDYVEAEANTFPDGDRFRVDWYLDAVGLVKSVYFDTYNDAVTWLALEGFEDFTA